MTFEKISMSLHRSEQNNHKGNSNGNICHSGETKVCWARVAEQSINTQQETPKTTPRARKQKQCLTFCKDINRRSIRQEPRPALELPGWSLDKHGHHTVPETQRGGQGASQHLAPKQALEMLLLHTRITH